MENFKEVKNTVEKIPRQIDGNLLTVLTFPQNFFQKEKIIEKKTIKNRLNRKLFRIEIPSTGH